MVRMKSKTKKKALFIEKPLHLLNHIDNFHLYGLPEIQIINAKKTSSI
jgi:hypothetical protein